MQTTSTKTIYEEPERGEGTISAIVRGTEALPSLPEIRINSQRAITQLKQILDGSTKLSPLIQTVFDYIEYLEAYPSNGQQSTQQKSWEEEACALLASNQEELVRRFILVRSFYEEEQETRSTAEQDSQQVREENGELLEELAKKDTYIAELEGKLTTTTIAAIGMVHTLAEPETCTHCQELASELEQERQVSEQLRQTVAMQDRRYEDLETRHTDLYMKWEGRQKWREELLANRTISNPACKLVGTYLWENGLEYTDGERQFFKENIADDLGCSPDTVANALERLKSYNVINVRTDTLVLPDGTKHKDALTYISRNTLKDPTSIVMEKKQGAAKPRICLIHNRPYDNWTVRHCPECRTVGFFGQPGLPQGAGRDTLVVDIIRQHRNLIPHALNDNSEEKKPSSTATTANADAQLDTTPFDNTTSINDRTRTTKEKKPSSTALTSSTSEDDRWAAAEKILSDLNDYGIVLEYWEDGSRHLLVPTTTTAPMSTLKERIKQYEPEIRELLGMQASYDPQVATQILNATLPKEQQLPLEQEQVSAQLPYTLESTESFSEVLTPEPLCDICHKHEAKGTLYEHGEARLNYCKACKQLASAQLDTQYGNTRGHGNLRGVWL